MIGVSEPKKDFIKFLKGLKTLKIDYGNINVNFGDGIKCSELVGDKQMKIDVLVNRTVKSFNAESVSQASNMLASALLLRPRES